MYQNIVWEVNFDMKNLGRSTHFATAIVVLLLLATLVSTAESAEARRLQPGVDFYGPHLNLNIHGVPDADKFKVDSIGPDRHSIFVPLNNEEPVTIEYSQSSVLNWTVTDCDATGDGYASIILPRYLWIDTNNDGIEDTRKQVQSYKVYIAGLGKTGDNSMIISSSATFWNTTGTIFWEIGEPTIEGHKNRKSGAPTGQPNWQNATDLFIIDNMTLWNDTDGDGIVDQEWNDANNNGIIDAGEWTDADMDGVVDNELITYTNEWVFNIAFLENYWWDVKNDGVRLMQVRFYPVW
jgi:hypothetical protein